LPVKTFIYMNGFCNTTYKYVRLLGISKKVIPNNFSAFWPRCLSKISSNFKLKILSLFSHSEKR
jgi:hypothetical protein